MLRAEDIDATLSSDAQTVDGSEWWKKRSRGFLAAQDPAVRKGSVAPVGRAAWYPWVRHPYPHRLLP